MADAETLAVYGREAARYAEVVPPSPSLDRFLARLAPGARVLDLGCGPGQDAEAMAAAGFRTEALDGCPEMVARAAARPGVAARLALFEDFDEAARYGGIWASFSLLHVPRAEMPDLLARTHRALVHGGLLHLGLKTGSGSGRDGLGRFYTYWSEADLTAALTAAGFTVIEVRHGAGAGLAGIVEPHIEVCARA